MALPQLLDASTRSRRITRVLNTLPAPGETLRSAGFPARATRRSRRARPRAGATRFLVVVAEACPRPSDGSPICRRCSTRRRGAVSAARRIRRGRATPRGRRRARRDARARLARRGAHAGHHRARGARADAAPARCATRGSSCARATCSGSSELIAHLECVGFERVHAGRRRRAVQRARRHRRHLQLRHGGSGAPRVVGRRDHLASPLRSRHAALHARGRRAP